MLTLPLAHPCAPLARPPARLRAASCSHVFSTRNPLQGLVFAVLSAIFNGTWGLCTKTVAASPAPIINFWVSEGVSTTGLLLLAAPPREISAWGVLSGALFVLSAGSAVAAIRCLGLAVASGIWCGVAVLASFGYGVLVAGDELQRPALAATGLALLLAGIAGIAAAGWWSSRQGGGGKDTEQLQALLSPEDGGNEGSSSGARASRATRAALGCGAAVAAGALGGLILAPMTAAPESLQGLQYLPSMALGTLLTAPLLTAALATAPGSGVSLQALGHPGAMRAGMAGGALWNAGNACSILATTDPRVGLAVAYPIMQCGLFVAGAWGILLYGEVAGRGARAGYAAAGAVLVAGAALLASAK